MHLNSLPQFARTNRIVGKRVNVSPLKMSEACISNVAPVNYLYADVALLIECSALQNRQVRSSMHMPITNLSPGSPSYKRTEINEPGSQCIEETAVAECRAAGGEAHHRLNSKKI